MSEGRTWIVQDFNYPDEGPWTITDFDPDWEYGNEGTWIVQDFNYPDEGPWLITDFRYNHVFLSNDGDGDPGFW